MSSAVLEEETVFLAWHLQLDLTEQQAIYRALQLVCDNPTLQARVEQPVKEITPEVDTVCQLMLDVRGLAVRRSQWRTGPSRDHDQRCGWSVASVLLDEVAQRAMLRFLSLAGTYGQLDLSNMAVIEVIARRVELIEYQYQERSREGLRASGLGASAALTGAAVLGGEEAGGACVAPAIVGFVVKTAKIDK